MGKVRFGRSGRLGFPQGAHRGEKGGACGHEGVECVDTHLHLTRIFLPRRSLSTTSIMRAVAYPSGCVEGVAPRMAVSTFCHQFSRNFDGADRQTKFSTVRFGHFERARPSCGPEAPCCSSRYSSGASWAPARRRPCRSVRHPRSPTGARASTHRRHPREKRPHSKRGPNDDDGELTHHSHPSPTLQVRPERVLAHRVPGGIQRRVPAGLRLRHVTRPRRHGVRRDQLRGDADGMRPRGVLLVQGCDVDDIAGRRAEARDGGCTGGERLQGRRRGGRNQLGVVHQRRVQFQGFRGDGEDLIQRSHVRGLLLVPGGCRGAGVQGELRGHHGGWRGDAELAVVLVYHIVAGRDDDDGLNIKLKLR